ncbi:sensor histidine kinase [Patescibacteria group bacterium]
MKKPDKKPRFTQTTFGKILLAIVATTLLSTTLAGMISFGRINNSFEGFLQRQELELENIYKKKGAALPDNLKPLRSKDITEPFKTTIVNTLILSSGIGIIVALFVGAGVSIQIIRPLSRLKKAVRKVSKNDYKTRVPVEGSAEIRSLMIDFNKLIEKLEHTEKLRENLVTDVAHELKTPLTKMRGQVEGIRDGLYQADDKKMNQILSDISQLEYLVERLQEIIQVQAGKQDLKKKDVKVLKLVDDVVAGYSKKGIQTKVEIKEDLQIKADRGKLREIIDNLIENAFKYTEKGVISITANAKSLIIKDTGLGIPKKDLDNVFERFFRVDKSRSSKTGGAGLGLAIVKDLVDAHGWTINVKSKLKTGTTFTIKWK